MKQLLVLGAALMAITVCSFADTISGQCGTTATGSLVTSISATNFVCPSFSSLAGVPGGSTLNSLTIIAGVDYGWSNPISSPAISVTGNFVLPGGFSPAGPLSPVRSGNGVSSTTTGVNTSVLTGVTAGNTYTVVGSASLTNGPTPDTMSVSVFYTYDYTAPTNNAIPEPSSMALMGGALVGIGALLRRRK